MFSFAYPAILILLISVPILVALYIWARIRRNAKLRKFGNPAFIKHLMPDVSPYKAGIKVVLKCAALTFLVLALARPWGGIKNQKTEKEGIEVIIAMDASNSMYASATSDPDGTSRMRTAKLVLEKLINRLDNDRVGLLMYAGSAYTLIPVTNDYVSAKMFLNSIDPSQVSNQGTNISAAIDMASNSFGDDKNVGKAIILITDAEELEYPEAVMEAAKNAAKNNIQIDVVGVGSSTPVPLIVNGQQMIDGETGEPVKTALNENLAADISKAGKGIYVNAGNSDALSELEKQLDTLKKSAFESSTYSQHDELFATFLWIAFILIIIDLVLEDSKIKWLDRFTFFKKEEKK